MKALLQFLLCLQIGMQTQAGQQKTLLVGGQGFVPQKLNIIKLDWIGTPFDTITSYIIQDSLSADRFEVGAWSEFEICYTVTSGQGKAAAAVLAKDPRLAGFVRYCKPYNKVKDTPEPGTDGRVLPQGFGTGFRPLGTQRFLAIKLGTEKSSVVEKKPMTVKQLWQRARYYRDFEGHIGRGIDYIAYGLDAAGHNIGAWYQDVDGTGHYQWVESFYGLPGALNN